VVKVAIRDALDAVKFLVGLVAPMDTWDMQFCNNKRGMSMILIKGKMTGLHHTAKAGKRDMTALLLDFGARRSLTNFEKKPALDLAVEQRHQDIVFVLQN
jgi:hypothetical protein